MDPNQYVLSTSPFGCANLYGDTVCLEQDGNAWAADCEPNAPWHLAALTAARLPSYGTEYAYNKPASSNVIVYVFDTWLDVNHPAFMGRATRGPIFIPGIMNPHGTHVAGLVGAHKVGVNREVRMVSVQVLDDGGRTKWSVVLKALEWLATNTPAILNLSLLGDASETIDTSVRMLIERGWKVVAAAGNSASDACAYSPARVKEVVTVGALNSRIRLSDFTNVGECVDILAPGSDILSAYPGNRWAIMSGTSMSAPLVAGAWSMTPQLDRTAFLQRYSRFVYPLNKTMLDCKARCKGGLSACINE